MGSRISTLGGEESVPNAVSAALCAIGFQLPPRAMECAPSLWELLEVAVPLTGFQSAPVALEIVPSNVRMRSVVVSSS